MLANALRCQEGNTQCVICGAQSHRHHSAQPPSAVAAILASPCQSRAFVCSADLKKYPRALKTQLLVRMFRMSAMVLVLIGIAYLRQCDISQVFSSRTAH